MNRSDRGNGRAKRARALAIGFAIAAVASTPFVWSGSPGAPKASELEKDVEAWRAKRLERLSKPDGWLSLVGLGWLEEGANSVGSLPASKVRLPAGSAPAKVGVIEKAADKLRFVAESGAGVTSAGKPVTTIDLVTDKRGKPTTIEAGSVSFFMIERSGRFGVRVKDSKSPALAEFRGIENFPIDPKFRIEARWELYDPPRKVKTMTVIGTSEEETCPGAALFEIDGKKYRLEPVLEEPDAEELFFVFGDATNGSTTYGGGRFFYAPLPKNGTVILDFNKAYNPPCVFTPYATCGIPRKENRLPIRILAGEKGYKGAKHH